MNKINRHFFRCNLDYKWPSAFQARWEPRQGKALVDGPTLKSMTLKGLW